MPIKWILRFLNQCIKGTHLPFMKFSPFNYLSGGTISMINSVKLFWELLGQSGFGKIDTNRSETPKEG